MRRKWTGDRLWGRYRDERRTNMRRNRWTGVAAGFAAGVVVGSAGATAVARRIQVSRDDPSGITEPVRPSGERMLGLARDDAELDNAGTMTPDLVTSIGAVDGEKVKRRPSKSETSNHVKPTHS